MEKRTIVIMILSLGYVFTTRASAITINTDFLTAKEISLLKSLTRKAEQRKNLGQKITPSLTLSLLFDAIASNDMQKAEYATNQWMKKNISILESLPPIYIINREAREELETKLHKFLKLINKSTCNKVYQYIINRINSITSDELKILSGVHPEEERKKAEPLFERLRNKENIFAKQPEFGFNQSQQLVNPFGGIKYLINLPSEETSRLFDAIKAHDMKQAEYAINQWLKKHILIVHTFPVTYTIDQQAAQELKAELIEFLRPRPASSNEIFEYIIHRINTITSEELKALDETEKIAEKERFNAWINRMQEYYPGIKSE